MAPAFVDLGSDFQPAAHLATAIHNAVIKDYFKTRDFNSTYTAKATVALIAENGTILSKVYLDAPLVPKETLEKQFFLQKLTQAPTFAIEYFNGTLPTAEDFLSRLDQLGIRDQVDKVAVVKGEKAGLPGYTAFILGCLNDIPAIAYAFVATFKDEPETAVFIFRATEFTVPENAILNFCTVPVPLNTTGLPACPPAGPQACLVANGPQTGFDTLRDMLIPTWQNISGLGPAAKPNRVLCLGHSLGASMAGLCTVFIKGLVPSAEVIFQGSGMPRIGNEAFMKYLEDSVSNATTIINNCDPIPSIPPSALTGFVDNPSPIWLLRTEKLNYSSTMAFATQRPPGIYFNPLNHLAEDYLAAMEDAVQNAPKK
eukprot:jgi/Botrbrau1/17104/Bobra.0157s0007.2